MSRWERHLASFLVPRSSFPSMVHDASHVTWAVLLGRWVEFAQSALALPDDAEGERVRQSVPDIIMLQAVTFALRNLDDLDRAERDLGLDRAELLINQHSQILRRRFAHTEMPHSLCQLIQEAAEQLALVRK